MDYKRSAIVTVRTDNTQIPPGFPSQTNQHQRRIAVFGSKNCGKTALCVRYVETRFLESYYPTIRENQFMKLVKRRDDSVATAVELLDTAGQNSVRSLLKLESARVGWLDGIVLCYSVDDRRSFEMVKVIWDELVDLLTHYYRDIGMATFDLVWFPPVLVVGNKVDLRGRDDTAEAVSSEDGNADTRDMYWKQEEQVLRGHGLSPVEKGKGKGKEEEDSDRKVKKSRYVSLEEGQDLVVEIQREIGAKYNLHHMSIDFIECSSKLDYQVTAAMQLLLRKIETLRSSTNYGTAAEDTICSIV